MNGEGSCEGGGIRGKRILLIIIGGALLNISPHTKFTDPFLLYALYIIIKPPLIRTQLTMIAQRAVSKHSEITGNL